MNAIAEAVTIESVLDFLKVKSNCIPQPEGREVVEAYRKGLLDQTVALNVIAVMLSKARNK
jgi:hypothetical protein